ncbi:MULTISPECIES: ATP-binding cassette domain-containing protein [unclassified Clostridium]|uniref:ABC transporter ATP-binding protein n=1 Tax=unclassified Clostridium TaxID=2614128 RepID=UPI0025B99C78|nr:ABC transporter ATP-binding protein [Clostridium sp.]MDY4251327.1 ABC transporter ATP-binding protein [Clostridium sp.]
MALIKVSNLTKEYGKNKVLDNVSLTIEENKIYGLLGRNGAGKTTLLNLITNRIFPTEGTVEIDGENIIENSSALEKIYFMTEQDLYPKGMKIKEIFKWTKEFYESFDMDYALSLSNKFGLNINKKFKELSTGYSSICKIIITLSSGAEVLLFDEPVLGLDANHRDMFYKELVANYIDEPKTIILSTHIIEEVSEILEKVIIIKNGKVLGDKEVESLLGEAYLVSGPSEKVEKYIKDKKCINIESIAGFKAATIIGKITDENKIQIRDLELETSKVELQKLFIHLTGEEEVK